MKEIIIDFFKYFNLNRFIAAFLITCCIGIFIVALVYYATWYHLLILVGMLIVSIFVYHIM